MINLLTDKFLTVKYRDGTENKIKFSSIVDPDIIDIALPRADFVAAAYQFAIATIQTCMQPNSVDDWMDLLEQPPSVKELDIAIDKISHAFNLIGDGPLFMQDFEDLADAKMVTPIASLLIEAPGENTLKLNTDHFIKRNLCNQMSLEMAALALITLQINAPSGGQGHRTGIRGGGPLTTLIKPHNSNSTLWQKIWFNVLSAEEWKYAEPNYHSEAVFPWLAKTKVSKQPGSEVYPEDVHDLHMYWAMPRRIRLETENIDGVCELSGELTSNLVSGYKTINYGYNYSGSWYHPLTHYRTNPQKPHEPNLSSKGQPGGITYSYWQPLLFNSESKGSHPAKVVQMFGQKRYEILDADEKFRPRLWVFGYDMDNMKARCWYSSEMPILYQPNKVRNQQIEIVQEITSLSAEILKGLRDRTKAAVSSRTDKSNKVDYSALITKSFYMQTENMFFRTIEAIKIKEGAEDLNLMEDAAINWMTHLKQVSLSIFDGFTIDSIEREYVFKMKEYVEQRKSLESFLNGFKNKTLMEFKMKYIPSYAEKKSKEKLDAKN